jgi:hypothetical protein
MIPICKSGSTRHAEYTSRLRNFDSISGRASVPIWRLRDDHHERSLAWQPKTDGGFPCSPVVEDSPLKHAVHQLWTPRHLVEQLLLWLIEVSGP